MITIKEDVSQKIEGLRDNNYYVVADFDKTITDKKSNTTFSLFSKSGLYPKEYLEERNRNYEYYRPLELDANIRSEEKERIVKAWQEASYQLLLKYQVKEEDIKKVLSMPDMLILRDGAIEFIRYLNEKNIPLIICSAGISNFIKELLILNECYSSNIFIYGNMLEFRNGQIIDSKQEKIHSMNKNNITLSSDFYEKIKDKNYTLVIGDQLSDLNMVKKLPTTESISFGFLESNVDELRPYFQDQFDVVLEGGESFHTISKIIRLQR